MISARMLWIVILLSGFALGWLLHMFWQDAVEEVEEQQPLYWVAPMDPNYRRDKPGKSPMGMDLVPVYAENADSADDERTVKISPTVQHNLGLRTAEVTYDLLPQRIDTVGTVQLDEDRLYHVHSRVAGWIETLYADTVGKSVQRGEPLFDLYSPTLVNAQDELLIALRTAGSNRNTGLVASARQRLRLLGLEDDQIAQLEQRGAVDQVVQFRAPQDGYISELNVRTGMFITPATDVMAIADWREVWVIAEVFARQIDWIKVGQPATMRSDSFPGQTWSGEVDFIYPELDPQWRTARLRLRFANPDGQLKSAMLADVTIIADDGQQRLSVPRSAVIRDGQQSRVVQVLGDRQFRSVVVETGIETRDRVEILSGLQAGDDVVTSAQFLIDSESHIPTESGKLTAPAMEHHHDH